MFTRPKRSVLKTAALGAACAAALAAGAHAQTDEERRFSEETGRIVLDAQERMAAGDHDAAGALLDEALAGDLSGWERFVALQMRGQAHVAQDDFDAAIGDWRAALDTGAATPEQEDTLRINLGQLLIVRGDIEEGASLLEPWAQAHPENEAVTMLLAQALAQDGQHERALPYAEQARDAADPVERKHLALLAYLYGELGRAEDLEAIRSQVDAL